MTVHLESPMATKFEIDGLVEAESLYMSFRSLSPIGRREALAAMDIAAVSTLAKGVEMSGKASFGDAFDLLAAEWRCVEQRV